MGPKHNFSFFLVALFFLILLTGCIQYQERVDQSASYNKTSAAIDIALRNESVQSYLAANWSIMDVSPNAQVTLVQDGGSATLNTTDVKVETDSALVHVYVDLPNKTVVYLWIQPKRTPMP